MANFLSLVLMILGLSCNTASTNSYIKTLESMLTQVMGTHYVTQCAHWRKPHFYDSQFLAHCCIWVFHNQLWMSLTAGVMHCRYDQTNNSNTLGCNAGLILPRPRKSLAELEGGLDSLHSAPSGWGEPPSPKDNVDNGTEFWGIPPDDLARMEQPTVINGEGSSGYVWFEPALWLTNYHVCWPVNTTHNSSMQLE